MMCNLDNNASCESQSFEVVENGPDSHDYVIKTVKGESSARTSAAIMQERYAYLGYGYTIRQVA